MIGEERVEEFQHRCCTSEHHLLDVSWHVEQDVIRQLGDGCQQCCGSEVDIAQVREVIRLRWLIEEGRQA